MFGLLKRFTGAAAVEQQAMEMTTAIGRTMRIRENRSQYRNFKAADSGRLQASWNPSAHSPDSAVRMGLSKMRRRSRQQFYDNEYAKHFYRLLKSNIVGPTGIRFQSKVKDADGSMDREANRMIEDAFKRWGKRGTCDVTGKYSWADVQRLVLENTARDGDMLVQKVAGFPNAFGFAVRLIEGDMLDETYNGRIGKNIVRMGVEVNSWERPVAYHVLRNHPGDYVYGHQMGPARERIPADQIIHIYLPEFLRQSRGFPWLHAALARLNKMGNYEEAELLASLYAAGKMGFYEPNENANPEEFDGDEDQDEEFIEEFEAGTFGVVPYGYKVKEFDPSHPAGNYDPFMKRMMRAFSAGAGINYCSIGSDLSEVNFSSIRFGTDEDRDIYMQLQNWLIEWLCEPVAEAWLPMAIVSKQIKLPFTKLEKFQAFAWRPRRWKYINPLQDATAKQKELDSGQTTLTELHAERGSDYEEYLETLQAEADLETEYGVSPPLKQAKAKN